MLITEKTAHEAAKKAGNLIVTDICIGVGYTGVVLSNGECGIAYTIRDGLGPRCGAMDNAGKLIGINASQALDMAMSLNLAEAAVGVATANAILNADYPAGINALEEMIVEHGDVLGTIGYFHPVMNKFSPNAAKIHIFERRITDTGLLPDWAENIYLPQCDVVVITGVTFINKTIDHVLSLCTKAREIVVMGASACMAPEILKEYGVTVVAGSRVFDAEGIMRVIAQGGGGQDVLDYLQKLCVRISPPHKC